MWYHNGELLENYTNSSLILNSEESADLTDVFGVYQCFSTDCPEEIMSTLTRVLPFGKFGVYHVNQFRVFNYQIMQV